MAVALEVGETRQVLAISPTASGSTTFDLPVFCDSLLGSVYISAISGTLDVVVDSVEATGGTDRILTFPQFSSTTSSISTQSSASVTQLSRVTATYSDACTFQVYLKGLDREEQVGRSWVCGKTTITTSAALIISSPSPRRISVLIQNANASSGDLTVADTEAKAGAGSGPVITYGSSLVIDLDPGCSIWGDGSESIDVRYAEVCGTP